METQREIEAVALENLKRQRDEIDQKMREIEEKRVGGVRADSVIGYFDGAYLLGEDGRTYPVPANYISKSQLLDGDKLRLYLGDMIYKQIERVPRKTIFAVYIGFEMVADADGKEYNIVKSSVSYHRLVVGCEVICDVKDSPDAKFAAIKGVTKRV